MHFPCALAAWGWVARPMACPSRRAWPSRTLAVEVVCGPVRAERVSTSTGRRTRMHASFLLIRSPCQGPAPAMKKKPTAWPPAALLPGQLARSRASSLLLPFSNAASAISDLFRSGTSADNPQTPHCPRGKPVHEHVHTAAVPALQVFQKPSLSVPWSSLLRTAAGACCDIKKPRSGGCFPSRLFIVRRADAP